MGILSELEIDAFLSKSDINERLVITPILDKEKQIGPTTVDLRLGTKFKVDMKTRTPFIDVLEDARPIDTFFDETYRDFGERFLLYPGQLVLGSTFEYIRLPNNLFGMLFTRSSWNRLGLSISSLVQPGYAGVLTMELINKSSNPIALYPGLRFAQLLLYELEGVNTTGYLSQSLSKYIADSEPVISNIFEDRDLEMLKSKFPF